MSGGTEVADPSELLDAVVRVLPTLPVPPAWFTYVTFLVSALSMLASLRSTSIARASYRRGGPRVAVRMFGVHFSPERSSMFVGLSNAGLAPVQVDDIDLYPGVVPFLGTAAHCERFDGPELPVLLPANASLTWGYEIRGVDWTAARRDEVAGLDPPVASAAVRRRFRVSVLVARLGNGQTVSKRAIFVDDVVLRLMSRMDRWST